MRLTLFEKRPYEFQKEGGGVNKGFSYSAYSEDGDLVQFSSPKDYPISPEAMKFEKENCIDIHLQQKVWQGKIKRSEIV